MKKSRRNPSALLSLISLFIIKDRGLSLRMMYRRDGLIFAQIKDPLWADPKIAKILPNEENGSWGVFISLKGTEWEKYIDVVSLEALDRAYRGDCTPLMKLSLRDPKGALKKAPIPKICADSKNCVSYKPNLCTTSSKTIPECFSVYSEIPPMVRVLLSAWNEGYFIVREKE